MMLLNIGVLIIVTLVVWWLTGHDKNVSGESKRDRHLSRAIRSVAVVFLVALLLWFPGVLTLLIAPISSYETVSRRWCCSYGLVGSRERSKSPICRMAAVKSQT